MQRYTKCPVELQQLGLPEIVISEESERDQQRMVLQVGSALGAATPR
jgi:hypothetical protein